MNILKGSKRTMNSDLFFPKLNKPSCSALGSRHPWLLEAIV